LIGRVAESDTQNVIAHLTLLQDGIKTQNEQLQRLQYELEREVQFKQFRQEYDGLAGTILQLPDRQIQTDRASKLQIELDVLKSENEKLCATLELRNKQFALLMRTVASLETTLDEERELEEIEQKRRQEKEQVVEQIVINEEEVVVEEEEKSSEKRHKPRKEKKVEKTVPKPVEESSAMDEAND
jgi:DNA gyrase/topoisomerase IV subunit A